MIPVTEGMSMTTIMLVGEHESMYTALANNTIDAVTSRMADLDSLMTQLSEWKEGDDPAIKADLISKITTLVDQERTSLETCVQNDLTAQRTAIEAHIIDDTIGSATESHTDSKLFNLVATDTLRKLIEKFISVDTIYHKDTHKR